MGRIGTYIKTGNQISAPVLEFRGLFDMKVENRMIGVLIPGKVHQEGFSQAVMAHCTVDVVDDFVYVDMVSVDFPGSPMDGMLLALTKDQLELLTANVTRKALAAAKT